MSDAGWKRIPNLKSTQLKARDVQRRSRKPALTSRPIHPGPVNTLSSSHCAPQNGLTGGCIVPGAGVELEGGAPLGEPT
jgi:hypothetical protein